MVRGKLYFHGNVNLWIPGIVSTYVYGDKYSLNFFNLLSTKSTKNGIPRILMNSQ